MIGRRWRPAPAAAIFCLMLAGTAAGQDAGSTAWLIRTRVVDEVVSERNNTGSPLLPPTGGEWRQADLVLATVDSSWTPASRLKLAGAVAVSGDTRARDITLRVREAYGRVSVADWMDAEAGKRVLKWGTGYAFTPTGVLDPPRQATDPQDRLGVNEGVLYAGAHLYRGATSLSLVAAAPDTWRSSVPSAPKWTMAGRLRTLLRGVDVSFIAGASDAQDPAVGANVSHVIGRRFEWHGELMWQSRQLVRTPLRDGLVETGGGGVSGLVGCQYSFDIGASLVVEYYRDANGLPQDVWEGARVALAAPRPAGTPLVVPPAFAAATRSTGAPGLQQFLFVRAAPVATEVRLSPDIMTIVSLGDGSVTVVPSLTWTVQRHLQAYGRATVLTGSANSVARVGPSRGEVRIGLAVRF